MEKSTTDVCSFLMETERTATSESKDYAGNSSNLIITPLNTLYLTPSFDAEMPY
jgi:hypothetical protein